MKLQIRKDVEDILPGLFPKLKIWQYVCLGMAVFFGVFFAIISPFSSGMDSLFMVIFAGLPGSVALFNKKGLDFMEYSKKKNGQKIYVQTNRKEEKNGPLENLQEMRSVPGKNAGIGRRLNRNR